MNDHSNLSLPQNLIPVLQPAIYNFELLLLQDIERALELVKQDLEIAKSFMASPDAPELKRLEKIYLDCVTVATEMVSFI